MGHLYHGYVSHNQRVNYIKNRTWPTCVGWSFDLQPKIPVMFHPGFPLNAKRADFRPRLEWACAKKKSYCKVPLPFPTQNIQNNSISGLNSGRFSGNSRLAVNRCQYLSPQIGQVAQIEQHFLFTSWTDSPMRRVFPWISPQTLCFYIQYPLVI